ncbi:type II toxin-antitoxin system HicA family toxin [Hafnia alvei]|uniref:type II toxin-antitoxin system HicA family toxin n=1 Tax=Hafnia alvei TaxID=569 RepID=UPI002DBE3251|nr:type II toxin-antitoxin system HicA family toxin [Hafnia alvei]MEB7889554.1 type II toxin-antitoxin system HicA family toxin [Hafnia alvei]
MSTHKLSARHQRTLYVIFTNPPIRTLEWRKIENLLIALGAVVSEGQGSRVKFEIDGFSVAFHRPHPGKNAKIYQIIDARVFLEELGVIP